MSTSSHVDNVLLALVILPTLAWTIGLLVWRLLRGSDPSSSSTRTGRIASHLDRIAILRRWGTISPLERNIFGGISILVATITLLSTIMLIFRFNTRSPAQAIQFPLPPLPISLYADALSLYFLLVINIIALGASWNAYFYLQKEPEAGFYRGPSLFHVLMNLFHFTMLLTPVMDNLIGLWIAIESTTLVSALLVAYPNTARSWEAAWKYLIITSTGIILAFMGTVFLIHGMYASNDPVLHTMNWSELIQHIHLLQRNDSLDFVLLAFFFALAGYGVKAGLAPMHTWLPDAHGEAAPPISALFSGVLIKAAFYAILRFVMLTEKALGNEHLWLITYVLLGAGLFSLTMAVPFILNRKNHFKRVLAYHSLEHMGIILFGTGVGSAVALFGALLHVLNHAITKALMFLAYGNVLRKYNLSEEEGRSNILEPAGVFYLMPVTGLLLAMGGLALVGTPPFNIFLSLWMILWGGVQRWLEVMHTQSASRPLEPYILGISILIFSLATTLIYFGLVQHLARILLSHPPARKRIQEKITELIPLLLLMGLTCVLGVIVLPPLSILIQRSVDLLTLH